MTLFLNRPNDLIASGLSSESLETLEKIEQHFALSISKPVRDTIQTPDDPVGLQYLPRKEELNLQAFELADPIGDDAHSPVPGVVHRYPDRCLIKIANVCPVYCRFCFRKEKIGPGSKALAKKDRALAYEYIRRHPQLWEVILTGGDPLFLNPNVLAEVIENLSAIEHIQVIRIHSRVPFTLPERINETLFQALQSPKMVCIAVHANHLQEFSPEAKHALSLIRKAGIPMVSQSVLLKGVNDSIEALTALMRAFVENGVKPYYLHHLDPARGTSHFHVPIEQGQTLMEKLRGRVSGLCQPTYVIDIPGGFGKSPLSPQYLDLSENQIQDYQGKKHQL